MAVGLGDGVPIERMSMQEYRSFDHYFGTLSGVRGFDDPHALRLPNGDPVWRQPDPSTSDGYRCRIGSTAGSARRRPSRR
jgi:phospholipase C